MESTSEEESLPIEDLPSYCLFQILSFLPSTKDLARAALVSKRFNELAQPQLWRAYCCKRCLRPLFHPSNHVRALDLAPWRIQYKPTLSDGDTMVIDRLDSCALLEFPPSRPAPPDVQAFLHLRGWGAFAKYTANGRPTRLIDVKCPSCQLYLGYRLTLDDAALGEIEARDPDPQLVGGIDVATPQYLVDKAFICKNYVRLCTGDGSPDPDRGPVRFGVYVCRGPKGQAQAQAQGGGPGPTAAAAAAAAAAAVGADRGVEGEDGPGNSAAAIAPAPQPQLTAAGEASLAGAGEGPDSSSAAAAAAADADAAAVARRPIGGPGGGDPRNVAPYFTIGRAVFLPVLTDSESDSGGPDDGESGSPFSSDSDSDSDSDGSSSSDPDSNTGPSGSDDAPSDPAFPPFTFLPTPAAAGTGIACGRPLLVDDSILSRHHVWRLPNSAVSERAMYVNHLAEHCTADHCSAAEREEQLAQGTMTVSDLCCTACGAAFGWRFLRNKDEEEDLAFHEGRAGVVLSAVSVLPVGYGFWDLPDGLRPAWLGEGPGEGRDGGGGGGGLRGVGAMAKRWPDPRRLGLAGAAAAGTGGG